MKIYSQEISYSEIEYKNKKTPCILNESTYSEELLVEGLRDYMKKEKKSSSSFSFNYETFKKIKLDKMPLDSSPYVYYNFHFKLKSALNGAKYNVFMCLIITTTKDEPIDLVVYKDILKSAKIWMEEFMDYFKLTFIPEREKRLLQENITQLKVLKEKTIKDSLETIGNLKIKIREYEDELLKLNNSLKTQRIIFENSIIKQIHTADSLQNKLDSLKIQHSNYKK